MSKHLSRHLLAVAGVVAMTMSLVVPAPVGKADEAEQPAPSEQPADLPYEPEVALIEVDEGTSAEAVSAALASMDGLLTDEVTPEEVASGMVSVELAPGVSVEDAVDDLQELDVVSHAQPNYCYRAMEGSLSSLAASQGLGTALRAAALTTNDPRLGEQWALGSINAFDAWSVATGGHAVTVAVVDVGFDLTHEDLTDNIVASYNAHTAANGGSGSDSMRRNSHGTHVLGIIAGTSNNGIGISGASYNAQVMPINVADDSGNAYTKDLVEAYDYLIGHASEHNVRVVNISMGTAGDPNAETDDAFLKKIDEAYAKGIVTVAAAGNSEVATPPFKCYPGDYNTVVSVINLRQGSSGVTRDTSSNYNAPNERTKNISAPGEDILSTVIGGYKTMSGTSMSAPYVSAILALEFVANPGLSAADAVNTLYATAVDLGRIGWDAVYGWGEANAYYAVYGAKYGVDAAKELMGTTDGGEQEDAEQPAEAQPASWSRLAGADRYDTMATVVQEGFPQSDWAVVVSGENFPDALTASSMAGVVYCPVILTKNGELSSQARGQLSRLGVSNVVIAGGTSAVSETVEQALRDMGISVRRVAGADRMATSVEAFRSTRSSNTDSSTVIIASGARFPDSLSISPYAYTTASPIVLTRSDGTLTQEAVSAIQADAGISRVVLVGGTAVVSDEVRNQLGAGYGYERLGGANRYETSKIVAEWEVGEGLSWTAPAVATGQNFPDALAGGALCGYNGSTLLLAHADADPAIALLQANKARISRCYVLGGESAVPATLAATLAGATA